MMPLRTLSARRYVTPLREGGSLPAIVEADDDGLYVLKFRGAGQGLKVLVAETISGELARAAGLDVPPIVAITLDAELARSEPDPEIQELIRASAGLNFGIDYLPGSVTFDPVAEKPDAMLASQIVWLDAFLANVDRTARNTNLLVWHRKLWLIDHGAALYYHHGADDFSGRAEDPFPAIKDHVLLPLATRLAEADAKMADLLSPAVIHDVIEQVPTDWLPAERRAAYETFLVRRLAAPRAFAKEAERARTLHV